MANTNPLNDVATLLGGSTASGGAGNSQTSELSGQLTSLTQQLQQLETVNQEQITSLEQNTQAVTQNSSAKESGGTSTAGSVGSTLESVLGFGLGLSPLISGLVSLFGGGGGSSQPAPLVPYVAPLPVSGTAGISASSAGASSVDTADGGLPRPQPAATASSAQITVQVQAMDSQSFLDHSNDIAMAVRQAMLQSTTLNDVIREV
ncbi:MAG TPA: hypothetical protein VK419_01315 [Bryobacteraceae bacterium]|nr:hypothetical protein [Bryobacteraceae bacterium]